MAQQMGNDFANYLTAEYENIAEAHFKTIETISTFFKHYLAIIAIPISVVVFFFSKEQSLTDATTSMMQLSWLIMIIFITIALVGLGVLWYILNLRLDVLLYARTINAIRKHYYDTSGLDIAYRTQMRVLPQSRYAPSFLEFYFWPVVFCFGLLDSLCILFATLLYLAQAGELTIAKLSVDALLDWRVLVPPLVFFVLHLVVYRALANHREFGYLTSNTIGIDIDGVLNAHRGQFCSILKINVNKDIDPDKIDVIPVHECQNLGTTVTRDDEKSVFNDPKYWTQMPAQQDAAETIARLRNSLKLSVHVFTHRPWPITARLPISEVAKVKLAWKTEWNTYLSGVLGRNGWWTGMVQSLGRLSIMERITRLWLKQHGFEYDKLMVEKGSEDVSDRRAHLRNRFIVARSKQFRYFVEDDLVKARKLAHMCDVVFLIDQPYNKDPLQLPGNIIRVSSWEELYKTVKSLS